MVNNDRLLIQILLLALLGAGLWVMAPFISAQCAAWFANERACCHP